MKYTDILLLSSGVLLGSVGAICLKFGAVHSDAGRLSGNFLIRILGNPYVVGGFALYFIPALIWLYLLSTWPVSKLQPLVSLTYATTPLLALWLLNEPVPASRWVGIALIIIGVSVVARS